VLCNVALQAEVLPEKREQEPAPDDKETALPTLDTIVAQVCLPSVGL
jgi:hypothetical protein